MAHEGPTVSGFPRLPAAAVWAMWTLVFASAASGQSSGLFTSLESERPAVAGVEAASVGDSARRLRLVAIDFAQLERVRASLAQRAATSATLTLNLFEDTSYDAIVERTEPTFSGGYSVSARIAGEPLGTATLVVNGATVAGTVRTPRGTYRIRSAGDGRYAVSEVDASKLPEQCEVVGTPEIEARFAPDPK